MGLIYRISERIPGLGYLDCHPRILIAAGPALDPVMVHCLSKDNGLKRLQDFTDRYKEEFTAQFLREYYLAMVDEIRVIYLKGMDRKADHHFNLLEDTAKTNVVTSSWFPRAKVATSPLQDETEGEDMKKKDEKDGEYDEVVTTKSSNGSKVSV